MNPADVVLSDHNYSRLDLCGYHLRPTKSLFIPKTSSGSSELYVDVSTVPQSPSLQYDFQKSRQVMEECERFVMFARNTRLEETNDDWEESIPRSGWSHEQISLFRRVVKILHSDRLARLALQGSWSEPAKRRALVDRSAQRFREVLASVQWNVVLSQWLHGLLIEHLDIAYLSAYLDILQTLKVRIPTLVDRLVAGATSGKVPIVQEAMNLLLKRPWDPAVSSINSQKLGKLPTNPVIVLVPSSLKKHSTMTPRCNLWSSHLSNLATLISVTPSLGAVTNKVTVPAYLEHMVSATKARLAGARSEFPGRPLVLVGWRSGAAVALQAAATEPVAAVVSLGLSTRTAEGTRGDPDDSIYSLISPVLFVTGENSNTARPDDFEEIRSKMLGQTGLVVVGSSDDCLRMGRRHKITFGVTQSLVDRKVLEEIGEFLASVLTVPLNPLRPDRHPAPGLYRRRRLSTGSSEETEVNSKMETPAKQLRMALTTPYQKSTVNGNLGNPVRRGRRPNPTKVRQIRRTPGIKTLIPVKKHEDTLPPAAHSGDVTLDVGSIASLAPTGPIIRSGAPNANNTVVTSQHKTFRIHGGRLSSTPPSAASAAPPTDVMPLRLSDSSTSSVGTSHVLFMGPSLATHNCVSQVGEIRNSEVAPANAIKTLVATTLPRMLAPRSIAISGRGTRGFINSSTRSPRLSLPSSSKIITSQNNVILLADKRTNMAGQNLRVATSMKTPDAKIVKNNSSPNQVVNRIAMNKRYVQTTPPMHPKPYIIGRPASSSPNEESEAQDIKSLMILKSKNLTDAEHENKPVLYLHRAPTENLDDRSVVKIVKSRALTLDKDGRTESIGKSGPVLISPQRTKQVFLTQSGDQLVKQEAPSKFFLQMQPEDDEGLFFVADP